MKPFLKLLHTADIHLDCKFSAITDPEIRNRCRQLQRETFKALIQTARNECVDLMIIAGDLFESHFVSFDTLHFIIDQFSLIPQIPIVLVAGNHDPYAFDSPYNTLNWGPNVHIFKNSHFKLMEFPDIHARIWGASTTANNMKLNLLSNFKVDNDPNFFTIITCHASNLDKLPARFSEGMCSPFSISDIESIHCDYIALGHYHEFQILGPNNNCVYSGIPQATGFDEQGNTSIVIAEVRKNAPPIISTKTISHFNFKEIDVDISSISNATTLSDSIFNQLTSQCSFNDIHKINLKGELLDTLDLNEQAIAWSLKNNHYYIQLQNNAKKPYPIERLKLEPTVVGHFIREMLKKRDSSPNQTHTIDKMIEYGLDAFYKEGDLNLK